MGYEFHSYLYLPYLTANNANLYSDPEEPNAPGFYHISDGQAVKYLTYLGVPESKIILGFPAYFHSYGGVSAKKNGLYQPFNPDLTPIFNARKSVGSNVLLHDILQNGYETYYILMNGKISAAYAYNPTKKTSSCLVLRQNRLDKWLLRLLLLPPR